MAFIKDLTGCQLELLRDDGEFALYRARQPSNAAPVLALSRASRMNIGWRHCSTRDGQLHLWRSSAIRD